METITIDMSKANAIALYNQLRKAGWRTLWTGNGQICMCR